MSKTGGGMQGRIKDPVKCLWWSFSSKIVKRLTVKSR